MQANNAGVLFTFVNDGSTDGTLRVIEDLASQRPNRISVHHISKNGGKAEAVRKGMLHVLNHKNLTDDDLIAFWDADLVSAPPHAHMHKRASTLTHTHAHTRSSAQATADSGVA